MKRSLLCDLVSSHVLDKCCRSCRTWIGWLTTFFRLNMQVKRKEIDANGWRRRVSAYRSVRRETLIWIYEVDWRFVPKTLEWLMFDSIRKSQGERGKSEMNFSRDSIVRRKKKGSLTCKIRIGRRLVKDFLFFIANRCRFCQRSNDKSMSRPTIFVFCWLVDSTGIFFEHIFRTHPQQINK